MKIKVNRLPRVKLADLLEKYGLELTVEQVKLCGDGFKAEIPGLYYNVLGNRGLREVTVYGFGDSPHSAILRMCFDVDGYQLQTCVNKQNFVIGRIELIPPDASEIEEVP